MLKFDPPQLRDDLARAIEVWKRQVDIHREDDFSEDLVDVTLPGFDPAEHEDRTITSETEFGLFLPEWEDAAAISYGGFVKLAEELEQARLIEGCACWTNQRYLLRVAPANDQTYVQLSRLLPEPESEEEREAQLTYIEKEREHSILQERLHRLLDRGVHRGEEGFDEELYADWVAVSGATLELADKIHKPTRRYLRMPVSHDSIEATCSLIEGFTIFGPAVAASGDYDGDFPPIFPGEVFVEIRFRNGQLSEDTARYIADAYLFELSRSVGLEFEVDPRPSLDYEDPEEPDWRASYDARLRPLLLGMGMPKLLLLYKGRRRHR